MTTEATAPSASASGDQSGERLGGRRDRLAFRAILGGSVISGLGDQVYYLALPWLIYDLTQSAVAMNGLRAAEFMATVVLGVVAGHLVDVHGPRRSLLWAVPAAGTVLCLLALGVPHLSAAGIPALYLAAFALSATGRVMSISLGAALPRILPREELGRANAHRELASTLTNVMGTGVAGALLAALGVQAVLVVNAVSFAALLIPALLLGPGARGPKARKGEKFVEGLGRVWAFLRSCPPLLYGTLTITAINLFISSVGMLNLYRMRSDLGFSAQNVSLVMMLGAAGAALGTFAAPRAMRTMSAWMVSSTSLGTMGAGSAILAIAVHPAAVGAGMALVMGGVMVYNVAYTTLRQTLTPEDIMARVLSLTSTMMKVTVPLGLLSSGVLAASVAVPHLLLVITVGLLTLGALAWHGRAHEGQAAPGR